MKRLLFISIVFVLFGCASPKYVNFDKRHNYYQRHRYNTYTTPIWIPGRGILLETHIYRGHKPTRHKH